MSLAACHTPRVYNSGYCCILVLITSVHYSNTYQGDALPVLHCNAACNTASPIGVVIPCEKAAQIPPAAKNLQSRELMSLLLPPLIAHSSLATVRLPVRLPLVRVVAVVGCSGPVAFATACSMHPSISTNAMTCMVNLARRCISVN